MGGGGQIKQTQSREGAWGTSSGAGSVVAPGGQGGRGAGFLVPGLLVWLQRFGRTTWGVGLGRAAGTADEAAVKCCPLCLGVQLFTEQGQRSWVRFDLWSRLVLSRGKGWAWATAASGGVRACLRSRGPST